MSAAEQAAMGGAIPPHIITFEGRLINNAVPAREIDELQWFAKCQGFDLDGECLAQYGYKSDWLNREQWKAMNKAVNAFRDAKTAHKPKHHHTCFECGRQTLCYAEKCKDEAEDECRECHEGTGWIIKRMPMF